eukprot:1618343-Rhodomonas_salina.2
MKRKERRGRGPDQELDEHAEVLEATDGAQGSEGSEEAEGAEDDGGGVAPCAPSAARVTSRAAPP